MEVLVMNNTYLMYRYQSLTDDNRYKFSHSNDYIILNLDTPHA